MKHIDDLVAYYADRIKACEEAGGKGRLECEHCEHRETCLVYKTVIQPETKQWGENYVNDPDRQLWASMFAKKYTDDRFGLSETGEERITLHINGIRIRKGAAVTEIVESDPF